jgi:hypothetical protein
VKAGREIEALRPDAQPSPSAGGAEIDLDQHALMVPGERPAADEGLDPVLPGPGNCGAGIGEQAR